MPRLTPTQRTLRGQIAALERWGRTPQAERKAQGKRGQAGLLAKFEGEVDPDGTLPPDERARQVDRLYRAHMARVRLARSKAGAARKAASDGAA